MDSNESMLSTIKRWLLLLIVATMPLQENIPLVLGMSFPFILLVLLTIIIIIQGNWNRLIYAMRMPIVLSLFLYVGITLYVEYMHESSLYAGILRTLLSYLGAVVLGVAISDIKAFKSVVIGYIISGIYLGVVLYAYGWGMLSTDTSSFFEADAVRDEVLSKLPIRENANNIAARAAICVILISLVLLTKADVLTKNKRILFIALIIQTIALFVTMSRTGFVILIATMVLVALFYKLFSYKRVAHAIIIVAFLYLLAPQAYLDRMQIGTSKSESTELVDSRTYTFNTSIKEIRKNYLWGTGEGNLWIGEYSKHSALSYYNESKDSYFVGGTHNLYFQTILQWGVLGLLAFLYLQYNVIKLMPSRDKKDFVSLAVATFNIAILLLLFFVHEGSNKEFSVAYGLLIAYHLNLKNKKVGTIYG